MDTYGFMYRNSFYPYAPFQNLIARNDDDAGGKQFRLWVRLDTVITYYLVVGTFFPNVQGPFSITSTGIASITFSPIDPSGKNSI